MNKRKWKTKEADKKSNTFSFERVVEFVRIRL